MEAISQWAASLCFAAAAGGLCQMLAPDSGLGRVLKLSISVFFLCSLLLPLGALELDFSDVLQTSQQEKSYELSEEITEDPLAFVQDKRLQLDYVQQKLLTAANAQWQEEQRRFAALAAKLDALSPLKVLGRGYAMARTEDGAVLRCSRLAKSSSN